MPTNFTVSGLMAEARALEAEHERVLAKLRSVRQLIAALKDYSEQSSDTKTTGTTSAARVGGAPASTSKPSSQFELTTLKVSSQGKQSIRDAVYSAVRERPGITVAEVRERLLGQIRSDSPNQRKVIATRIGQFVKEKNARLRRDGEKLYLAEEKK